MEFPITTVWASAADSTADNSFRGWYGRQTTFGSWRRVPFLRLARSFRNSVPPPTKQKLIPGSGARRWAASITVFSGWHGVWLPEYITTKFRSNPCCRRNLSLPSASNRTSGVCDHGGTMLILSGCTPLDRISAAISSSRAMTRSAPRRLILESCSSRRSEKDPLASHPAATASSGLRSMVQWTNLHLWRRAATNPTTEIKGGEVNETTTSCLSNHGNRAPHSIEKLNPSTTRFHLMLLPKPSEGTLRIFTSCQVPLGGNSVSGSS